MEELITIILAIVSLIAGLLGSLLGLGGGFIIVPALSFMNITPNQIASTSLFSVLSTSSSSTIAYAKQKRIDYRLGLRFAIFAIPGSILGAYTSSLISLESFKLYFAIILIGTSIYMLKRRGITKSNKNLIILAYLASFFAGFISSLFGIGGGVIYMPLMIGLLAMPAKISTATSQFILLISSISGLITHAYLGHPDYILAIVLIIGTFLGAQIGAKISLKIKERLLRDLVALALIAIAIRMIISVFNPSV
ncbi:MAG: sulfite exporter TauE/SafE family protein [Candidatus Nitrosothermus koennekii]|nr:MAG: sulfite exporter TauE/SafE family protein [Candidatus Nitrosothermus koennekii]